MWVVNGKEICMAKGDYGIQLPIKVTGITLGPNDEVVFELKRNNERCHDPVHHSRQLVLSKTFTNIEENTIILELTEEESKSLGVGVYTYCLDWHQSGNFLCNMIPSATFKVVDKA